jgi:predicted MPP superfamily phosphohydrolase
MKTSDYLIFFGVVFAIYGLVNFYIFIRGWQALPAGSGVRTFYLSLFLFFSLSFFAGRFLERVWMSPLSTALVWVGSFWLAGMAYFFLSLLVLDLIRLVNSLVPFFPEFVTRDYPRTKLCLMVGVVVLTIGVVIGGAINALVPETRVLEVAVPKKAKGISSFRIVAASDIHLGTIIGGSRLNRLVERINGLNPDIVLLPGDIIDEDVAPVIAKDLGDSLRNIRSRLGVVAVTGNHEYIGGADRACAYLAEHGITVLRDSVLALDCGVQIVGREDRSIRQFSGKQRKPLEELMVGVDRSLPVVLLDHQPIGLDQAERSGVDVQLSGHTHHGQLWPFNLITNAIYEVSWGFLQKGGTSIYVSSGFGTWGPPVRTGNRPEVVSLTLQFLE